MSQHRHNAVGVAQDGPLKDQAIDIRGPAEIGQPVLVNQGRPAALENGAVEHSFLSYRITGRNEEGLVLTHIPEA